MGFILNQGLQPSFSFLGPNLGLHLDASYSGIISITLELLDATFVKCHPPSLKNAENTW